MMSGRRGQVLFGIGLLALVGLGRSASVAARVGQAPPLPIAVYVEHTGSDEVGRSLAYRIRESLRGSPGYPLAATVADAAVRLLIVSVDSPCGSGGSKSAISLILLVNNQAQSFLTARVVDLGSARVEDEAQYALAKMDSEISQWRNR